MIFSWKKIISLINLIWINNNFLWFKLFIICKIITKFEWFSIICFIVSIVMITTNRSFIHSKQFYFWVCTLGSHITEFWSYKATDFRVFSSKFIRLYKSRLLSSIKFQIDLIRMIIFLMDSMFLIGRFNKHKCFKSISL